MGCDDGNMTQTVRNVTYTIYTSTSTITSTSTTATHVRSNRTFKERHPYANNMIEVLNSGAEQTRISKKHNEQKKKKEKKEVENKCLPSVW